MSDRSVKLFPCLALLATLFSAAVPALAEDSLTVKTASDLQEQYHRSVVHVSFRLSFHPTVKELPSRDFSAAGTVIDSTGLVVIPSHVFGAVWTRMDPNKPTANPIRVSAKLSDAEIILEDGQKMPATIVLVDKQLGAFFLRPTNPEDIEAFADRPRLSDLDQAEPGLLEEVIAVGRHVDKPNNRPTAAIGRIRSILKKPQTQYSSSVVTQGALLFTADGKLIGIGTKNAMSAMPLANILKAAEQIENSDK